jgi:hypothetical protein
MKSAMWLSIAVERAGFLKRLRAFPGGNRFGNVYAFAYALGENQIHRTCRWI